MTFIMFIIRRDLRLDLEVEAIKRNTSILIYCRNRVCDVGLLLIQHWISFPVCCEAR